MWFKRKARPDVVTKSSIMLGLGETDEEIQQARLCDVLKLRFSFSKAKSHMHSHFDFTWLIHIMNLNASPSRCIFSISGAGLLEAIGIQSDHWAKLLPRFCAPDSSRSPWCGRWDGDIWTVLLLSCQTWGMPSMLGLHLASASVRLQVRLGHCVRTPRPEHRPSQDNCQLTCFFAEHCFLWCPPLWAFPVQSVRFHALRWAGTSSQPRGTWRQIKGPDIGPSCLESLTSKRASSQFLTVSLVYKSSFKHFKPLTSIAIVTVDVTCSQLQFLSSDARFCTPLCSPPRTQQDVWWILMVPGDSVCDPGGIWPVACSWRSMTPRVVLTFQSVACSLSYG